MRAASIFLALLASAITLAACNRTGHQAERPKGQVASAPIPPTPMPPAAPPVVAPTGFHHEAGFAPAGYYMPASQVRVGDLQLAQVSIGSASDFEQWESGQRTNTFGPVLLEFDDVSSPMVQNEMGGEGHTVTVRVLPTAYNLDTHTLSFAGSTPRLGQIVLQARFDRDALNRAMNGGESSEQTVARGVFVIGGRRFENVPMTYFAGD